MAKSLFRLAGRDMPISFTHSERRPSFLENLFKGLPLVLFLLFLPQISSAGCTWEFDWYCSDCAKIGGRTTGTESGYPTEAACDSARNSVDSHVTTMSCDRVGWCDDPVVQPPLPESNLSQGNSSPPPTVPNITNNRQYERMEQQRRQQERDQKERKEREQRAFEDAKSEALDLLKGTGSNSTDDSGLKLKSGTATFGLKANPSGDMMLKQPSSTKSKPELKLKTPTLKVYSKGNKYTAPAVTIETPISRVIDPVFFTRPKQRLTINAVPNPKKAAKGTWLHYVKSDRASLILDALEEGKGDLDLATEYLEEQILLHDIHIDASSALSYLEGLKTSYIATDTAYKRQTTQAGTDSTLESKLLLKAIKASARRDWPGPTNPDPASKHINPMDWKVQRSRVMLAALEQSADDLKKTYQVLQSDKDTITASNAEYYLRGIYAYWDFLGTQE